MQLDALILYRADGRRRSVTFRSGLNIITGESGTGKTSIINILRFLLKEAEALMRQSVQSLAMSPGMAYWLMSAQPPSSSAGRLLPMALRRR